MRQIVFTFFGNSSFFTNETTRTFEKWVKENAIEVLRLGKTFAKALKKRCGFIALDEAHNIKANDSKRALAYEFK